MDRLKKPIIQSVIFVNEPSKCTIAFIAKRSSQIRKNLQNNPYLTLTLDETHLKDPLQHEGIMIETTTRTSTSQSEIQQCYDDLQKKYGIDITAKILGMEIITDYIKIEATPTKIIHWEGPFYRKFVCTGKKN